MNCFEPPIQARYRLRVAYSSATAEWRIAEQEQRPRAQCGGLYHLRHRPRQRIQDSGGFAESARRAHLRHRAGCGRQGKARPQFKGNHPRPAEAAGCQGCLPGLALAGPDPAAGAVQPATTSCSTPPDPVNTTGQPYPFQRHEPGDHPAQASAGRHRPHPLRRQLHCWPTRWAQGRRSRWWPPAMESKRLGLCQQGPLRRAQSPDRAMGLGVPAPLSLGQPAGRLQKGL